MNEEMLCIDIYIDILQGPASFLYQTHAFLFILNSEIAMNIFTLFSECCNTCQNPLNQCIKMHS